MGPPETGVSSLGFPTRFGDSHRGAFAESGGDEHSDGSFLLSPAAIRGNEKKRVMCAASRGQANGLTGFGSWRLALGFGHWRCLSARSWRFTLGFGLLAVGSNRRLLNQE